jgi:hypothetical protein
MTHFVAHLGNDRLCLGRWTQRLLLATARARSQLKAQAALSADVVFVGTAHSFIS